MMRIVWPMLLGLLFLAGQDAYAQQPMERVYATTETHSDRFWVILLGTLADVENPGQAVDIGNPNHINTHSTLRTNVGLLGLGSAWQNVRFPDASLPAGGNNADVPIHVKLGLGSTVLNVLNGITISATMNGTPVGTAYSGASLLGLLGGTAQNVIVFTPGTNYNGVRITINPVVDIGTTVDLYASYFLTPAINLIACDSPNEVVWGSTGSIAGSLNSVDNPQNAIDGNTGGTPARLNATVNVLDETYITAIYNTLSNADDSVRLILQAGNQSLLDAGVLSSDLTIRTYNDNTVVSEVTASSGLLRLELLPSPGNIFELVFPVDAPFNRISVASGGGLATLLNGLNIYEIERIGAGPDVSGLVDENEYITCAGTDVTLTIDNAITGSTYRWYDDEGSVVGNDVSYNAGTLPAGDHIYYVTSTRSGCTTESGRTMVVVTVKETAAAADIDVDVNAPFCVGESVILTPSSDNISTPQYHWYYDQAKTQPIADGEHGSVVYDIADDGTLTIIGHDEGTYYYYVSVSNETICENASNALKEVSFTVQPLPNAPQINLTTN